MPHIPSAYQQSLHQDIGCSWTHTVTTCWTNVTANASANTKGSWTELAASTNFSTEGFWLHLMPNTAVPHCVDIGIGGAGSEGVLVPDVHAMAVYANCTVRSLYFPLHIPAGVRVAARTQGTTGSAVIKVAMQAYASGWFGMPGYVGCDGLHTITTGRLTVVDPGGTANTKGAWTQLIASTLRPYKAVMFNTGDGGDVSRAATASRLTDLGFGASSSEVVILPDVASCQGSTSDAAINHSTPIPFECDIPSGSRIAARTRCTLTTTGDRLISVQAFGFY